MCCAASLSDKIHFPFFPSNFLQEQPSFNIFQELKSLGLGYSDLTLPNHQTDVFDSKWTPEHFASAATPTSLKKLVLIKVNLPVTHELFIENKKYLNSEDLNWDGPTLHGHGVVLSLSEEAETNQGSLSSLEVSSVLRRFTFQI